MELTRLVTIIFQVAQVPEKAARRIHISFRGKRRYFQEMWIHFRLFWRQVGNLTGWFATRPDPTHFELSFTPYSKLYGTNPLMNYLGVPFMDVLDRLQRLR